MTGTTFNRRSVPVHRLAGLPAGMGRRGFTLTELLVVAAIVAAFAAMLFVVLGKVYKVVRSWE